MPAPDAQIALLIQTLQEIERHLASLVLAQQDIARLAAQAQSSPVI